MAEQVQKRAEYSTTYKYDQDDHERQQSDDIKRQKAQRKAGEIAVDTLAETDALLAEIDELLIEDSVFAVNYLQTGGE